MASVTVLMPVYNAEDYVEEAIKSILGQTFTDFKFLVINDGSTDGSENLIKQFIDDRITYVKHDINLGLISTLNEGLDLAVGKYIVRMDADDISFPKRIEKQVAFMEANPQVDISGTWLSVVDTDKAVAHPASIEQCRVNLLQNTVLGHPSVIMRKDAITVNKLYFDDKSLYAEDYKFWAEASAIGLKITNIPEVLMEYRSHAGQVSALKSAQQVETVEQIKLWYAQYFFDDILNTQITLYLSFLNRSIDSYSSFTEIKALVNELKAKNRVNNHFDIKKFEEFMDDLLANAAFRMYVLCVDCNGYILWKSIFDNHFYTSTSIFQKARFILKSIQKAFF